VDRWSIKRLTQAQQFMIASLVTLVVGMTGIGWWVGQQIEDRVIHQSAATTALYVDSFIAPNVEELAENKPISEGHRSNLKRLLRSSAMRQEIAAFKIWTPDGEVFYSANPAQVGHRFPIDDELAAALDGEVSASISNLDAAENVLERQEDTELLEIYAPIRQRYTGRVFAVAEFYQRVDNLRRDIAAAQRRSWLLVGGTTLGMYLLLAGFVQRSSNTIERQQRALSAQVARLTDLLNQNTELRERVQRAAARTTALNERFLRRVSADLHDGPAQDLGLALLRLDHVIAHFERCKGTDEDAAQANLDVIQSSLRHALGEIRAISGGLSLPQLNNLSITETLERVVRAHERRTGTTVAMHLHTLPEEASLPVKITLYRFVQEALQNAFRHAGGAGQQVRAEQVDGSVVVDVSDQGPGFDGIPESEQEEHLGLLGMRERIESLGGAFSIHSEDGQGTTVSARLALASEEGSA
jgi:signal transduction histidine kinase